jgi:hypothetical protein
MRQVSGAVSSTAAPRLESDRLTAADHVGEVLVSGYAHGLKIAVPHGGEVQPLWQFRGEAEGNQKLSAISHQLSAMNSQPPAMS